MTMRLERYVDAAGMQISVPPAIEPLLLQELKLHLRIQHADEDVLLSMLIKVAREYAEKQTGSALIMQEWKASYRYFGDMMTLPVGPVQDVSRVEYLDPEGNQQEMPAEDWWLTQQQTGWYITLRPGKTWPDVYAVPDPIMITWTAGYGNTADSVPPRIRQALLLAAGHWYQNREAVDPFGKTKELPLGIRSLLSRHWGQG